VLQEALRRALQQWARTAPACARDPTPVPLFSVASRGHRRHWRTCSRGCRVSRHDLRRALSRARGAPGLLAEGVAEAPRATHVSCCVVVCCARVVLGCGCGCGCGCWGLRRVHLPRLPIPVMAPKRSAGTSSSTSISSSDASSDSSSDGEQLPAQQTTRSGRTSRPPNRHVPSPGKLFSDTNQAQAARWASGEAAAAKRQRAAQRACSCVCLRCVKSWRKFSRVLVRLPPMREIGGCVDEVPLSRQQAQPLSLPCRPHRFGARCPLT
jgi:hypothetical protein